MGILVSHSRTVEARLSATISLTENSLLINRIMTMTRDELENHFFVRESFAVITIRKPGSKFVRIPLLDRCVGECKLMFHDAESTPINGRFRLLMPASQATKIVQFVNDIKDRCSILVCQCEWGDSLATAVAQPLSRWLQASIVVNEDFGTNRHVTTLVEMAIEWGEIEKSLTAKSE